jgi:hypothetical protein
MVDDAEAGIAVIRMKLIAELQHQFSKLPDTAPFQPFQRERRRKETEFCGAGRARAPSDQTSASFFEAPPW